MSNTKLALIIGGSAAALGVTAFVLDNLGQPTCDEPEVVETVIGLMRGQANMLEQVTGISEIVEAPSVGNEKIRCYGTLEFTIFNVPQRARIMYTVTETVDGQDYVQVQAASEVV